jgi:hypothetical protein
VIDVSLSVLEAIKHDRAIEMDSLLDL